MSLAVVIARAVDVVVLHEQDDRDAGVGEDLAVGVEERAPRVVVRPDLAVMTGMSGASGGSDGSRRGAGEGDDVGTGGGSSAGTAAFQASLARWACERQSHRLAGRLPGAIWKTPRRPRVVVGDHVEDVDARDPRRREVVARAVGQPGGQRRLRPGPAQVPGPEAVGRELLAGQVDEPDVAPEPALAGQVQQRRRGQRAGRRSPSVLSSAPGAASAGRRSRASL